MEQRDLTKYRLAKMIPCSPSTVTNWLNGTIPRGAIRARLIEVLGVSEDELFGDNKKPAARAGDKRVHTAQAGNPLNAEKYQKSCIFSRIWYFFFLNVSNWRGNQHPKTSVFIRFYASFLV
jgi:transcriptional regulator with XRE-family HTH domain